MQSEFWPQLAERIGAATASPCRIERYESIAGGCISSAYRLDCAAGGSYFVKCHDAARQEMFAAEAAGLRALGESHTLRVPHPYTWGVIGAQAYLVMEYLPLSSQGSEEGFGRQLAAMHRCLGAHYGWQRHNTIGTSPQDNTPGDDWLQFWRERRLGPQLQWAADKGYGGRLQRQGQRLIAGLDSLFGATPPPASLLHGDLWSGNYAYTTGGEAVIFDPACYYGDRETDLAMTELFGGFGPRFYAAYREAWPLDEGYAVRKQLYKLYHILNHLNLFGAGYAAQAEQMMDRLLSEM